MIERAMFEHLLASPANTNPDVVIRGYMGNEKEVAEIDYAPLQVFNRFSVTTFTRGDEEGAPTATAFCESLDDAIEKAKGLLGHRIWQSGNSMRLLREAVEAEKRGWTVISMSDPFQQVYESRKPVSEFKRKWDEYHLNLANKDGVVVNVAAGLGENRVAEVQIGSAKDDWNWDLILQGAKIPELGEVLDAAETRLKGIQRFTAESGCHIYKDGKPWIYIQATSPTFAIDASEVSRLVADLMNQKKEVLF